ncbi:MAG: hypothetical protein O3A53_12860 [Acidobacteria bacterium]|nr:hypothetical protein [Acidobacteriota bacterium]MDA1235681.1 hypothetical protein [Acidobacteriota bacterium]
MNYKLFVACFVICAAAATAQEDFTITAPPSGDAIWVEGPAVTRNFFRFDAALAGPGMRFEGEPVKDAPYSAEAITESTQTLSDGNRIRRENRSLIYRDSQGRTRREESINALGPWSTDAQQKTIFINDPVAGTHYVLNPNDHTGQQLPVPMLADHFQMAPGEGPARVAKRVVMRREVGVSTSVGAGVSGIGPGMSGAISTMSMTAPGETKEEDLGARNIEGVTAVGTKMTTTITAKQMGADRDILITFERWHSAELKVDVLTKRKDPRVGETSYRLTNINRSEPLPSLFEPPADFDLQEGPTVEPMIFNRRMPTPPQE